MADPATNPTTPPTGGMTNDQITVAINSAVTAGIAAAMKPLVETQTKLQVDLGVVADTLAKLPPAGVVATKDKPAAGEAADKPITAADLNKLLDHRDQQRQQRDDLGSQRSQFVKDKLPKLPAVYASQLGDDPAKWDEQAKGLQTQYEADLKSNGFKPVDVAGAVATAAGAAPAAQPVDLSKMTPSQQRDAALKALPSVGTTTAGNVTTKDMPDAPAAK